MLHQPTAAAQSQHQVHLRQQHLAYLSATQDAKDTDDHAGPRHVSDLNISQPRSRLFTADELAAQAAEAYKENAHYKHIEEQTLKATAPFVDVQKRITAVTQQAQAHGGGVGGSGETAAETTSSSPGSLRSRGYSHSRRPSLSTGVPSVRQPRQRAASNAPQSDASQHATDSSSVFLDSSSSPIGRRLSSLNTTAVGNGKLRAGPMSAQSTMLAMNPATVGNANLPYALAPDMSSSMELAALQNTMAQLALQQLAPQQAATLGSLYGVDPVTAAQNLSALQHYQRLRSMSLTAARGRQPSLATASPIGVANLPSQAAFAAAAAAANAQPADPLFAFTKFVVDAVRNNTVSHAELLEKERLRQELEAVLQALQPTARLVVYGSLANNLAIANCDMDLMVVDTSEDALHDVSVDLPAIYTESLTSQGYNVKLLSKTRTPIVKVNLEHMAVPYCVDISFDNALALHNTKLIATYAACDPRVPIMLMFVKLWTAVRRINDPHSGTLSSYGYALLLIYYLQNRCISPPVLPNLQLISAMGTRCADELECSGCDIWFFKDVEKIQQAQMIKNASSIGSLLEGFFSYFAYEFDFRDLCISIRTPGGIVTKTAKSWTQMIEHLNERGDAKVKDRYILSIEDPFEIAHNVGRSVTRAGLYEIRGEFMAATRYVRGNKLDEILNPHRREIVAPTSSTAMHSPQQHAVEGHDRISQTSQQQHETTKDSSPTSTHTGEPPHSD